MPFINNNNANLYYEEFGKSQEAGVDTIVFSHGYLFSHEMFLSQVDYLMSNYRVIVYDQRGHGQSDVPNDGYSIEELTSDALAVINELADGAVHFVGMSIGGLIGLRLALQAPDKLKSLTVINASAEATEPKTIRQFDSAFSLARFFGIGPVLNKVLALQFSNNFLNDPQRKRAANFWQKQIASTKRKSLLKFGKANLSKTPILDGLTGNNIPTLIIAGELDQVNPVECSERLDDVLGNSDLFVIPRAGHAAPIEAPNPVNLALENFLSKQV